MRSNRFNTARLIILSLEANLQLLVLVAASWNVNVTRAYDLPLPAGALCLILTSLMFFILVSIQSIVSRPNLDVPSTFKTMASLAFECGWTTLLLVLQLSATIGATVNIPPPGSAAALSMSHTFLIPAAWLATLLGLLYVSCLVGAVMAHKPMYPAIWTAQASSVDWFIHRTLKADSVESDSWTRYLNDIEASAGQKPHFAILDISQSTEKAPWAQNIRRGLDNPFSVKTESDVSRSSTPTPSKLDAALPPLPLRVAPKTSRFVERFRESQTTTRAGPMQFPQRVDDHDKPIPLPRWSQWIRAEVTA
ncbi:hypothetical protein FB45DRAFT_1026678 [Roridomyces roridus]|uniref:Transmembrane protein n=1 Tax=Roridomyces roridus TaxID=1738132 RepID=A0AAD7BWM0_9AGAR|nr:hypothetical protein FB45DRAFT_1026678 [Roridomyces roridus]